MKTKIKILKNYFKTIFKSSINRFIDAEIVPNVNIISAEETLSQLELFISNNQKGVYMRFGDGDIFLLKNVDDGYQKRSVLLSNEMSEALSLSGLNVFKCLAIHSNLFGYSEGMTRGNHKNNDLFALKLFKDCYKYFVGSAIYSPVALHFMATQNTLRANLFLKLLKSKTSVFIGNENIKKDTLNLLFDQKIKHIKTPSINAYSEIERIENEANKLLEKIEGFSVVCVAMGCSGRPLMKRIWKSNHNVFLFDFGSLLDGIDGNKSRTWLKMNNINYSELLKNL